MDFSQEKAVKLEGILKNKDFLAKVSSVTNIDELKDLIAIFGLEMTTEEVVTFCKLVEKEKERMESEGGELSEEMLDDVAGGGFLFVAGCIGLGVLAVGGLVCGLINGYSGND